MRYPGSNVQDFHATKRNTMAHTLHKVGVCMCGGGGCGGVSVTNVQLLIGISREEVW